MLDNLLSQLHEELAKDLLIRVQSGEATAAELTAAIRFLKDNGTDAVMTQDAPLENLAKSLPFQDPDAPLQSVG